MKIKMLSRTVLVVLFGCGVQSIAMAAEQFSPDPQLVERGRYVTQVSGCNDCHTPGYLLNNGEADESVWLIGDTFGW